MLYRYTVLIKFGTRKDAFEAITKLSKNAAIDVNETQTADSKLRKVAKALRLGSVEISSTYSPEEIFPALCLLMGTDFINRIEGIYSSQNHSGSHNFLIAGEN